MSMALCSAVLAAACTGGTQDETDAQRLARKTVACLAIADAEPSTEVADRYLECMQEVFRFDDSLNAASPSLVETEEFVAEYEAALKSHNADYDMASVNARILEANERLTPYLIM